MFFRNKQNIIYFKLVFTFCLKVEIVEHMVGFQSQPVQYSFYMSWFWMLQEWTIIYQQELPLFTKQFPLIMQINIVPI